jgi:catechol 2,3-dioxygenase-like lactoylglutathione lyase family enzyme
MHKSRLAGFIIDCQTDDLPAAAAFWSAALGMRTQALGPGEESYVGLKGGAHGLHIEVQAVAHPSRVHLDIEADDIDAEVGRSPQVVVRDGSADRAALLRRADWRRRLRRDRERLAVSATPRDR